MRVSIQAIHIRWKSIKRPLEEVGVADVGDLDADASEDLPGSGGNRRARTPRKMSVEHMLTTGLRLTLLVMIESE